MRGLLLRVVLVSVGAGLALGLLSSSTRTVTSTVTVRMASIRAPYGTSPDGTPYCPRVTLPGMRYPTPCVFAAAGEGPPSNEVTATPAQPATLTAPAALATVTATSAPTVTVTFGAPAAYPGHSSWFVAWPSIAGATGYRVWIDGKPVSLQPATVGATQGSSFTVACATQHRVNVQAHNGYGYGPLAPAPIYWTPPAC